MSVIENGLRVLIENGLVQILIFALVFALVYGTLRKIKFLAGDDTARMKKMKPVHTLLSMVMGLLVLVPHFTNPGSTYDIVPAVQKSIPQLSFLLLAVLGALILLGFFGMSIGRNADDKNPLKTLVFVLSIGFILWIFGSNIGLWSNPWSNTLLTPDVVAVIISVLVFAMIISFVMGKEKKPDDKKFSERLNDLFKGKKGV